MSVYLGKEKVGAIVPINNGGSGSGNAMKINLEELGIKKVKGIYKISETKFLLSGLGINVRYDGIAYVNKATNKVVLIDNVGYYGYIREIAENKILILPGPAEPSQLFYDCVGNGYILNINTEEIVKIPVIDSESGEQLDEKLSYDKGYSPCIDLKNIDQKMRFFRLFLKVEIL